MRVDNKHERYDVAFSLGAACACSSALRCAKLQFGSFPLDWIAGSTVVQRAALVASRFDGWLDKDDFAYDGKNQINGLGIFKNRRTGFTHLHDFSDGPIDDSYAKVVKKYKRRESRLFSLCDCARRILCVYISRPSGRDVPDEELHEARLTMSRAFPSAYVALVHFRCEHGRRPSDRLVHRPEDGICQIVFDYDDPERDVNIKEVAAVLVEDGYTVTDYRTAAEKRAYKLGLKMKKYGVHSYAELVWARVKAQIGRCFGIKPKTYGSDYMKM